MPLYQFQCYSCGLRFEALKSKNTESIQCKSCKEPAYKRISVSKVGFSANVSGPVPQNTGISSIDNNYDQVIGLDAQKKWDEIYSKRLGKHKIIADNPGSSGNDIQRTLDNPDEYFLQKKEVSENWRRIAKTVSKPFEDAHFEEKRKREQFSSNKKS